jgi:hypothetical protein
MRFKLSLFFFFFFFFFFFAVWTSGLCTCKTGTLQLEPQLQSILLHLFWRWGFHDPLDLSFPNR